MRSRIASARVGLPTSSYQRSPVVEDEQVDPAELTHQLGVATVAAPQSQQGKQARDALIEH